MRSPARSSARSVCSRHACSLHACTCSTSTRREEAERFAQSIGAAFTVAASLVWYVAGQHAVALALAGVIAVLASLESGLGLCVGCKVFFLGMRLGLIPPGVCEDCAPYLRAT